MLRRKKKIDALERLEQEANDDFRLLDEVGPTYFGADHLMELHARIRERIALFQRRRRLSMIVGACATGWLFLSIIANTLGLYWVAFAAFGASSASFIAFFGIVLWQKRRFESKGELEFTRRLIEEELRNRAQRRREKKM